MDIYLEKLSLKQWNEKDSDTILQNLQADLNMQGLRE